MLAGIPGWIGKYHSKKLANIELNAGSTPEIIEASRHINCEKYIRFCRYHLLSKIQGRNGTFYNQRISRFILGIAAPREFRDALDQVSGMTCIDLGANVGYYTKKLAEHAKCVIAFEPDPWAFNELQENVAGYRNVTLLKAAAGTVDKYTSLYRHKAFEENPKCYSVSSSIIPEKKNIDAKQRIEIEQIDFVRFLEELDESIGILKIDIEGAETELLERLFQKPELVNRIRFLFAETHERQTRSHKFRLSAIRRDVKRFEKCHINLEWH